MKLNFETIINGRLVEIKPATLEQLFDAIRCDWEDCYSSQLSESFVIHLN